MKECLKTHLIAMGEHHVRLAGHHGAQAKIMAEKATRADDLQKSVAEAQLDFHRAMEGEHTDMAEHCVKMAKSLDSAEPETHGDSFGSRDFRPRNKAMGGGEPADIVDMLKALNTRLDAIVPDGVHAVAPADNLRLVGRPGGPTVDVSDASIDSEFTKAFSFD